MMEVLVAVFYIALFTDVSGEQSVGITKVIR